MPPKARAFGHIVEALDSLCTVESGVLFSLHRFAPAFLPVGFLHCQSIAQPWDICGVLLNPNCRAFLMNEHLSKTQDTVLNGIIRHILTAGGGALATRGYVSEASVELAVGALITLVGVIWSAIAKKRAKK
ncbi:MAG: hypothetical protein CL569_05075 [Alphaproteobacteria bacterium]|nr:hypothetical protein [Alphaproteobacteria bacterium]